MDGKPCYDERIWAEHEAVTIYAAPSMSQLERDSRTNLLYQSCLLDGKWAVSILDAGLVTGDADYNALIGSRYEVAVELSYRFFDHPEIAQADSDKRATIQSLVGAALILKGDIEKGLTALADVKKVDEGARTQWVLIRSVLVCVLEDLGAGTSLDDRIRDFAVQFLKERKTSHSAARKAVKATTCGELSELLYG